MNDFDPMIIFRKIKKWFSEPYFSFASLPLLFTIVYWEKKKTYFYFIYWGTFGLLWVCIHISFVKNIFPLFAMVSIFFRWNVDAVSKWITYSILLLWKQSLSIKSIVV